MFPSMTNTQGRSCRPAWGAEGRQDLHAFYERMAAGTRLHIFVAHDCVVAILPRTSNVQPVAPIEPYPSCSWRVKVVLAFNIPYCRPSAYEISSFAALVSIANADAPCRPSFRSHPLKLSQSAWRLRLQSSFLESQARWAAACW